MPYPPFARRPPGGEGGREWGGGDCGVGGAGGAAWNLPGEEADPGEAHPEDATWASNDLDYILQTATMGNG